jgi:hypothetical protein
MQALREGSRVYRELETQMTNELNECSLYRHYDNDGRLLYVGISLSALTRLGQHKDASHWFSQIKEVKIEHFASRNQALEAEREAIHNENPLHNVMRPLPLSATQVHSNKSRADLLGRVASYKPIYTPQEIACLYAVSTNTVNKWISEGLLGHIVAGKRNTAYGEKDIIRITGWNLITFIEMQMNDSNRNAA